MKNLIKKILKEDFNPEDFNWIKEIDPMDSFTEWVNSINLVDSDERHGVKTEKQWLILIERTKAWIEEFTDETHQLLEYVENLNSSAGLEHTQDMFKVIHEYMGDDSNVNSYYVDLYRDGERFLRQFLRWIGPYGKKYNLTLEELLDLSHRYFERRVKGEIKESKSLKEYNYREKRSTTEITMALLHEAADHFAEGLRLIESATQFAYEENNEDLIRDLEKLRMSIQSGGDKMWAESHNSANIINRINDIIEKYS